jgi:hypothetical protein
LKKTAEVTLEKSKGNPVELSVKGKPVSLKQDGDVQIRMALS